MKSEKPLRDIPKDMPTIPDRIEHVRVSLNYPVRAFARKLGISQAAILNIVSRGNDPSMKTINSIVAIFPVSREWILIGRGSPWTTKSLTDHIYTDNNGSDIEVDIIKRIREFRGELGMSQAVFANEIGMSRDALAFMETNRSMPQVPALKKLIRRFKLNSEWVLFGEGDKFRKKS